MRTKKLVRTIQGMLVAFAVIFSSCEKIETSSLTLDMAEFATITVYVYAELDKTSLGEEFAPNNTKVMVTVPYSAYTNDPTVKGNWSTDAVVTNGIVEVEVPTCISGVNLTLKAEDFLYDQVQEKGAASATKTMLYSSLSKTVSSIMPNVHEIVKLTYTASPMSNAEFVTRKFKLTAVLDHETGDSKNITSGTVVTFYSSNWSTTATVGSNGIIESVKVPVNESVYAVFEHTVRAYEDGQYKNKKYRFTVNLGSYSETSPVTEPVDFNYGELWE